MPTPTPPITVNDPGKTLDSAIILRNSSEVEVGRDKGKVNVDDIP